MAIFLSVNKTEGEVMNKFEPVPKECTSWKELRDELDNKPSAKSWIYRGGCENIAGNKMTSLESSLEKEYHSSTVKSKDLPKAEKAMIRDFKRKYDGYDRADVENDDLYCLSLMRHYGAPTRLLDWTYSPYIAAYFGLEKWEKKHRKSDKLEVVVWCINQEWCFENALKVNSIVETDLPKYRKAHQEELNDPKALQLKRRLFRNLFMQGGNKFVFPVNTRHLHERLTVQQGVFLCPGDINEPLVEILASYKSKINKIIRIHWAPNDLSPENSNTAI
jgi:hypothetical protein